MKNIIISLLKKGKFGELQNFVTDCFCILGRIKKLPVFEGLCTKNC